MEIQGKIIAVLELKKGTNDAGKEWRNQEAVVSSDTDGQYPTDLAFTMFNDKIVDLKVGDEVKVQYDAKSREGKGKWAGRWFTNINAWAVDKIVAGSKGAKTEIPAVPPIDELATSNSDDDDLPF